MGFKTKKNVIPILRDRPKGQITMMDEDDRNLVMRALYHAIIDGQRSLHQQISDQKQTIKRMTKISESEIAELEKTVEMQSRSIERIKADAIKDAEQIVKQQETINFLRSERSALECVMTANNRMALDKMRELLAHIRNLEYADIVLSGAQADRLRKINNLLTPEIKPQATK